MALLSGETRALFDAAQKRGAHLRQATEDGVHNHPLDTIGIAFAAGLVCAAAEPTKASHESLPLLIGAGLLSGNVQGEPKRFTHR